MTKIAREMHVSERTLYREARRLNRALGARNRAEALAKAAQLGLLARN
jgi:DNA-binding NarL/FixJ family response regulator